MYGSRFVWILIKDFVDKWWEVGNDTECTVDELQRATEGYFIVSSLNVLDNNQMSVSNIVIIFVKLYPIFSNILSIKRTIRNQMSFFFKLPQKKISIHFFKMLNM
jgi:hypothetical protein